MSKPTLPDLERRYVELNLRAEGDESKPVIEGDAAVFGVETRVGSWFREMICAEAFTRVLSETPDVIGTFNHDWTYVLGRTTSGTLHLEQTDKSLRYSIDVNPRDTQAMSVWEKVKRGDVTQASFAFTVRKEEWTEPLEDGELALREIIEVGKLFDVGPVPFGQYPEASAQARSKSETFKSAVSASQASPAGDEDAIAAHHKMRRRQIQVLEKSVY